MDNEVAANLRKAAQSIKADLNQRMASACAIVRNDARKNAPHRTGTLQRSLDFEVSDDGTEGVIFSNLEYAPYVEVGTGIYSTKGSGRTKPWVYKNQDGFFTTQGQQAQPYLEPALQQNTSKIKDCFKGLY